MMERNGPSVGRRRRLRGPVVAVALVSMSGAGCAMSDGVEALTVDGAWARTTPVTATNGVVYFRVVSPIDDVLESVEVPASVAAGAELHETMIDGGGHDMATMSETPGVMSMVPLDSLVAPADEALVLEPGGKHLMLTGLAAPLRDGESFEMTLTFGTAGRHVVEVSVRPDAP